MKPVSWENKKNISRCRLQKFLPSMLSVSYLGPVVQSIVSLTSLLRVISLTGFSGFNIQYCKSYSHFFIKKFQHICVSLDVNFNEALTNDVVSFEQLGPDCWIAVHCYCCTLLSTATHCYILLYIARHCFILLYISIHCWTVSNWNCPFSSVIWACSFI